MQIISNICVHDLVEPKEEKQRALVRMEMFFPQLGIEMISRYSTSGPNKTASHAMHSASGPRPFNGSSSTLSACNVWVIFELLFFFIFYEESRDKFCYFMCNLSMVTWELLAVHSFIYCYYHFFLYFSVAL